MISVTRLDGSEFVINSDLIETVEATPDTVISFAHDKKVVVRESPEEIIDRIVRFRHRVFVDPGALHKGTAARTKRLHVVHGDQAES
jgi:flagellar protein FlbD